MYVNAMELFNDKKLDEATIVDEIERLYPLSNEGIQAQIMLVLLIMVN